MRPQFTEHPTRPGFVVVDPVESRQLPVGTDAAVEPTETSTQRFRYPVSSAATFTAKTIDFPHRIGVVVRSAEGEMLTEVLPDQDGSFEADAYVLELNEPMKLYLQVDSAVSVRTADGRTRLQFSDRTEVRIGVRSYHEQPAGTITVTNSPEDVRKAISLLGSSLKTTSCERSFPTLRGHPPLVEFGEEFHVPDGIERHGTGVTLGVPPEPEYLLPVAPLAYYLSAEVVPEPEPRLTTDAGFTHEFARGEAFQEEVVRVLKQAFTLDCITRNEGFYRIDLYERERLEERIDLEFGALYDRPLAGQLEAYLDVPWDAVADLVPTWSLAVDCRPELRHAAFLPFVADNLGVLRTTTFDEPTRNPEFEERISEFKRSAEFTRGPAAATSGTRGGDGDLASDAEELSYVELPSREAIEHAWVGEAWPFNASRWFEAGFENRLDLADVGDRYYIEITVVCNDEAMRSEYRDEQLYGERDELPYEVNTHLDVTAEELRDLLSKDVDFLHYIGHIEETEFDCADGGLGIHDIDSVGATAFLLNGCKSLRQGQRLVEAGSVGGIVTLDDVVNSSAVRIGQHVARLLNYGFSIGSALSLVQDHTFSGSQYLAVGNTTTGLVQSQSGVPEFGDLAENADGTYSFGTETFPTPEFGVGTLFTPYHDEHGQFFISPKTLPRIDALEESDVESILEGESYPVSYDGDIRWPDDFDL